MTCTLAASRVVVQREGGAVGGVVDVGTSAGKLGRVHIDLRRW